MSIVLVAVVCAAAYADDIFVDSGQNLEVPQSFSLTVDVGDLDADGDLDAFVGTYVSPPLLYVNDGTGAFTVSDQEFPPVLAGRVIIEDFNGDGENDVFILSHSFSSYVLFGEEGVLVPGAQQIGSMQYRGADAGDIDGDGDVDLLLAGVAGHIMTAWLNDGTGVFTPGVQIIPFPARAIALADLDGDGDLDAFCGYGDVPGSPWGNRVLINDGAGAFTDSGQLLSNRYTIDVRLADLDGDGDIDAAVANSDLFGSDSANSIWLNTGAGVFMPGVMLDAAPSTGIDLADLDADGDVDLVASNSQAPQQVWLNDGRGLFSLRQVIGDNFSQTSDVALGDLDGDGDPDAFLAEFGNKGERVLFNVAGCLADANMDGQLNLLDFVAFQNAWTASDPCADCNADGAFTIIDFICFQNAFQTGCN